MVKKSKKDKPIYDKDGKWVEERNRLISALRKVFRLHPVMKEVLKEARVELPPKILKDGSTGKKNQIRFRCNVCKELFPFKQIQVDHLETMIPLDRESRDMSLDEVWERLRCDKSNLQVICATRKKDLPKGKSSCHNSKSSAENYIRDGIKNWKANKNNAIYSGLSENKISDAIDFFSKSYSIYLKIKKEEEQAKEERKRLRKLKKGKK